MAPYDSTQQRHPTMALQVCQSQNPAVAPGNGTTSVPPKLVPTPHSKKLSLSGEKAGLFFTLLPSWLQKHPKTSHFFVKALHSGHLQTKAMWETLMHSLDLTSIKPRERLVSLSTYNMAWQKKQHRGSCEKCRFFVLGWLSCVLFQVCVGVFKLVFVEKNFEGANSTPFDVIKCQLMFGTWGMIFCFFLGGGARTPKFQGCRGTTHKFSSGAERFWAERLRFHTHKPRSQTWSATFVQLSFQWHGKLPIHITSLVLIMACHWGWHWLARVGLYGISTSGWWWQPIWKILVKLDHFPR